MKSPLIPIILSGGAGSRLWPLSRDMHPKPFIRLKDGESFLQKTFIRAMDLPDVAEVLTVTNRELFFMTEDDYRGIADSRLPDNHRALPLSYILEPIGRNTAPAIASAALLVAEKYGPKALMLVLAADHLIADNEAFKKAVVRATELASTGKLVTFGIRPTAPETGFGYIEAAKDNPEKVMAFVEKPNLEKAREYVDSGRYYWNSGMFCFQAGALLDELTKCHPQMAKSVKACMAAVQKIESVNKGANKGVGKETTRHITQIELPLAEFSQVPEDSIDFAVMEKSANIAVVPCDIGWSDIGSWNALGDLTGADDNGNRIVGEVMVQNATGCTIHASDRLIGAVGVSNLVIVDTADALLVADKSQTQAVKQIYSALKKQDHPTHKHHRTVHRPWGTYTVLEEGDGFKIKRIVVKPKASLSLQMHHHRSEHWIVVSGMAKVTNGEREIWVNTNESTYIPAGNKHRLENPGILDLVMIEVQSGKYLGEDDIVRFEDVYGRVKAT